MLPTLLLLAPLAEMGPRVRGYYRERPNHFDGALFLREILGAAKG